MRVFIAVDIDEDIKKNLSELQSQIQQKADIKRGDAKWVGHEGMHLTLKFLGEIKDEQVVEVCTIVKEASARHGSFDLAVESVGSFGGKSARVLWVGSGSGSDALTRLQKDIEEQLAMAGWPREQRDFTVHLTLCRIKHPKAGEKLARLADQYKSHRLGTTWVDSVTVYQSELTPTGPIYTPLGNFELK